MKEVLWELWELLITLIESSISMHFVCTFLDEDMHNKKGKQNWMFLTILLAYNNTESRHQWLRRHIYVFLFPACLRLCCFCFAWIPFTKSNVINNFSDGNID